MPADMLLLWNSMAMPLILGVSTFIGVMVFRFTGVRHKCRRCS